MTLEEILYGVEQYGKDLVDEMGNTSDNAIEVEQAIKLIQQEVNECMGEDETDRQRMGTEYDSWIIKTRNQLRFEIKAKLKEKGFLSE